MKQILRQYLFFVVSIYLVDKFIPGISYSDNWVVLLESSLLLFIVHFSIRPLANLIALPINVLTLGLFSFLINGLMLYLVTLGIGDFKVHAFYSPAVNLGVVRFNTVFVSTFFSYILIAFLISLTRNFFIWLCSK